MRPLFDTDILIDVGHRTPEAVASLAHHEAQGRPTISAVTRMELIVGCRDKSELRALNRFLRRFDLVHLTPGASARAIHLMEQYRLSHGLLLPDALIAATALEANLPFATKNQKDFRFIPGLNLLPYP